MFIKEFMKEVHQNAKLHGWWESDESHNVGELLMLCVSELVEAFEEYRNGKAMDETYYSKDANGNQKPEGVPFELADVVIRIMDLCEYFGIDIVSAVKEKHEYNKTRLYRHGNKRC